MKSIEIRPEMSLVAYARRSRGVGTLQKRCRGLHVEEYQDDQATSWQKSLALLRAFFCGFLPKYQALFSSRSPWKPPRCRAIEV
jgi:hypothetical protein